MKDRLAKTQDHQDAVGLCHDLRQYIAVGLLLCGMQGEPRFDAATQAHLARIQDVFQQMSDMVDATLDAGLRGIWLTDVSELVAECVRISEMVNEVRMVTDLDRPALACADPALLRRAVLNILENASRATGPDGVVSVAVKNRSGQLRVEVSDQGGGFGQIPSVRGLGMAAVGQAVRHCNGRLEIESGPTPGTTVRMLIPVADERSVS